MKFKSFWPFALAGRAPLAIISIAMLAGCFGGVKKPQPTELQPVTALVSVRQSWTSRIGPVNFPLDVGVAGNGLQVLPRHHEVEQPVAEFGAEKFVWEFGHGKKEDCAGQGYPRGRGSRKSRAVTSWARLLRGSGSSTPSVTPVPLRLAPGWVHVVLSSTRALSGAMGKQFVKLGLGESIHHPFRLTFYKSIPSPCPKSSLPR